MLKTPRAVRASSRPGPASDDLLELTETLLLLARAEAGQGLDSQPVALDEVAFEVAEGLRPRFREKGLALELPDEPLRVFGDRVALGLVVRNLLDNALKFTAEGGVQLTVRRVSAQVSLTVSDSGPGFPEAALPHLFERFYQADVTHRRTGSGLGLALARSLVRWHGGDLEAENRLEGGARVTLRSPLAAGEALWRLSPKM